MKEKLLQIAVLIPSLDPDQHLVSVVRGCVEEGFSRIVVVDDGSSEICQEFFRETETLGAIVVHHSENRGKGAALRTGLRAIRETFPEVSGVVTADGDGQHLPSDIGRVALALLSENQPFVLGVRDFSGDQVPWRSRAGNRITAKFFQLSTGIRCEDTQTGLRGIPYRLFDRMLTIPGDRYEYEFNVLNSIAAARYPLEMVPIETVYEDNNKASHFRAVVDSARIYQRPLKYAASSLICCVVDLALFWLLSRRVSIMLATIAARCISGFANFKLNQMWSFRVSEKSWDQLVKYVILCVAVMLLSGAAVTVLQILPIPSTLTKAIVDSVLFVMNYLIQRRFIFADRPKEIK